MKKFFKLLTKKNITLLIILLFIYFLPIIFINPDVSYFESLNRLPIPFWVYSVIWIVVGIFFSITFLAYNEHLKEGKNLGIRYGVRRFILYLILNYLFGVALFGTFFKGHNLFLTYVLALSAFITIIFVLMEALLINKKKSWLVVPIIMWYLFFTVNSIYFFLTN